MTPMSKAKLQEAVTQLMYFIDKEDCLDLFLEIMRQVNICVRLDKWKEFNEALSELLPLRKKFQDVYRYTDTECIQIFCEAGDNYLGDK